jgi:hypothetical protein
MNAQIWLGAESRGGLALPAAAPTASQLYAPRGVFFDEQYLVVADSGNHRVLLWHGLPTSDREPAAVVVGKSDFFSEGPGLLHLPTGVGIFDGSLLIADAWHHRILVWRTVPTRSGVAPDYAIGQPDLDCTEPNAGHAPTACSLYWPYGLAWINGWFWVADTGNRRVLGWRGLPTGYQPADVVLGQPGPEDNAENRGGDAGPRSFRWPHAIAGDAGNLLISDPGNHRVLGWCPAPQADADADFVLGQSSFLANGEFPYAPQSAGKLRFPYSISLDEGMVAVADTANNRVLLWNSIPEHECGSKADLVFGQDDFASNGENRWKSVTYDSLCWPYGIWLRGERLAVADSGNNRVMLWNIQEHLASQSRQKQVLTV